MIRDVKFIHVKKSDQPSRYWTGVTTGVQKEPDMTIEARFPQYFNDTHFVNLVTDFKHSACKVTELESYRKLAESVDDKYEGSKSWYVKKPKRGMKDEIKKQLK